MYLSKNILSSPNPDSASLFAAEAASFKLAESFTILIPLPPPPAAALIINGKPIFFASETFSTVSRVGIFTFFAISFACNLSAIFFITVGVGPIHMILFD